MKLLSTVKTLLATAHPRWTEYLEHPRKLSLWLEERHPRLAESFLSLASDVLEPYWLGRGVRVESASDLGVRLRLPYDWRNRNWGGGFYRGVLVSLAELGLHLFWERHIDPAHTRLEIDSLVLDLEAPIRQDVVAHVEIQPQVRDQIVFEMSSQGRATATLEVAFFSRDHRRLGAAELHYSVSGPRALTQRR